MSFFNPSQVSRKEFEIENGEREREKFDLFRRNLVIFFLANWSVFMSITTTRIGRNIVKLKLEKKQNSKVLKKFKGFSFFLSLFLVAMSENISVNQFNLIYTHTQKCFFHSLNSTTEIFGQGKK